MPIEFDRLRLNRRGFLELTGLTIVAAASQCLDNSVAPRKSEPIRFDRFKLGTNLFPEQARWLGLDPEEVLEFQLSLPFKRIRIPIRFSDVSPAQGEFDFTKTDKIFKKAVAYEKVIDLQLGLKTIGFPEIHIPLWLARDYPYLLEPYSQLDASPDVKDLTIQYIEETWKHYRNWSQIDTVQIENEPYSRVLDVTKFRWLSFEFNMEQINHLRALDPLKHPVVQNFPWDNPSIWGSMLNSSNIDILGINVYNNIYNDFLNKLLWIYIEKTFKEAETYKKRVLVTEYQVADWLNDDKTSKYPFDPIKREEGIARLQALDPDGLHFWDLPQLMWRAKNGDLNAEIFLTNLPKLAA